MGKSRRALLVAVAAVAITGVVLGGVVLAGSTDDDTPLRGDAYERATAAALEFTGGGEVIETEAGDDGAAYGVEIRKQDGSVVEVNLDADFKVIGSEVDDDGSGEEEEESDG